MPGLKLGEVRGHPDSPSALFWIRNMLLGIRTQYYIH